MIKDVFLAMIKSALSTFWSDQDPYSQVTKDVF